MIVKLSKTFNNLQLHQLKAYSMFKLMFAGISWRRGYANVNWRNCQSY